MEIYNSKQEVGCRILLILVCTQKKMQVETLSVYDYFSVHIDDIYSDMPCLHPSNPNHSSELVVRKLMIREALSFLVSKGLVQIELSEFGIHYYADKFSEDISQLLDCNYSRKYVEYVRYVDEFLGQKTEYEINKYADDYEKQRISDNVCKFHLLMENYKSDIERLEFIEEAHNVTEQLLNVECPVCHAISKRVVDVKQKELCHKAFRAEKRKIEVLIKDLKATLENIEINKTNIETEKEKLLEDINRLVNDMNESLRPVIDSKIEEISGLLEKRELWSAMYANDSRLKKYEDRIAELESSKETVANKSKGSVKDISEEKLAQFSEIVKKMLVSWNFIEEKSIVEFDKQNKDLCVDGKNKELFGKGARAIINSAFLIGLMKYCYDNRLCHPGTIILDTPLTTFKEKDKVTNEKDESVGKDIKMAVYEKLATSCGDYQIIIFENEEPTKELKSNINYIHFSGNANVDRKGFIPE